MCWGAGVDDPIILGPRRRRHNVGVVVVGPEGHGLVLNGTGPVPDPYLDDIDHKAPPTTPLPGHGRA